MKKLSLLALTTTLLLAQGCFRQEIQVAEYHVPNMATAAAANYIHAQLKSLPGIKTVSGNLETHTLTISYASSSIRTMNIEETIALSGFAVNNRPANPKAKLPKGLE